MAINMTATKNQTQRKRKKRAQVGTFSVGHEVFSATVHLAQPDLISSGAATWGTPREGSSTLACIFLDVHDSIAIEVVSALLHRWVVQGMHIPINVGLTTETSTAL
jgi:hypothetical protein